MRKRRDGVAKSFDTPTLIFHATGVENIGVGVPRGVRELAGVTVLFIHAQRGPLFWLQCHCLYRTVMPIFTTVVIPRVSERVADIGAQCM